MKYGLASVNALLVPLRPPTGGELKEERKDESSIESAAYVLRVQFAIKEKTLACFEIFRSKVARH